MENTDINIDLDIAKKAAVESGKLLLENKNHLNNLLELIKVK